jgi:predicted transcriptional regulator
MKLYNKRYFVKVELLKALLVSPKPLLYKELVTIANVNNNINTRNILSAMKRMGLVKSTGKFKHYLYTATDKAEPYLEKVMGYKLNHLLKVV